MTTPIATGLAPMLIAIALFIAVYAAVIADWANRAVVALLGAGLLVLCGVLTQEAAIRGIDFNTIGLLLGMMVIVGIMARTGVFQYIAIRCAKLVRAEPAGLLVMLSLVTALASALLDNVTTVLLIVPVTLLLAEELRIAPYPFLLAEILFSNIGGTATLIGDPPNIMIASAANIGFNEFLIHLAPIVFLIALATLLPLYWIWRKELHASDSARRRVLNFQEREAIKDALLLKKSLLVLTLVLFGFTAAHSVQVQPATIALVGAALLLLLDNLGRDADAQARNVHEAFAQAEWVTLLFFAGLFVLVQGLQATGVIEWLAQQLLAMTGGELKTTVVVMLWGSALLSAFIDNIPFVATMIPLIKDMAPQFGGEPALMPLWWSLALGACLGGNGTLIGASANLIVAGFAERAGYRISFLAYFKSAFLLMLMRRGIPLAPQEFSFLIFGELPRFPRRSRALS